MGLGNPGTFLANTDRIVTGKGFKKSMPLTLANITAAAGTALSGTTTAAGRAAVETSFIALMADNNGTAIGSVNFIVPRDYDATVDKMYFRFLAVSAGDTDTPAIDATLYQKVPGVALSADLNPTISASIPNDTADAGWVEVVADGLGLVPGAAIQAIFTAAAHTTDKIHIYGFEVVYYSDLVYYESSER